MTEPLAASHNLALGFLDSPASDPNMDTARVELREHLAELRRLPGFPQGSDEDILQMSYPPYYTACPNPFIAEWLERLDRPSDDGRTDPGPFASDVVEGKGNAFYKAHSYPTKVPHPAIMRFILHYTRPGDVVLDGFSGSGMTGVAAQACGNPDQKARRAIEAEMGTENIEWGTRRAILSELGPSATYISAGVNLPVDGGTFDRASRALLDRFEDEYGWMYRTTVKRGDGSSFDADIDYVVWSEVFTCPHCGGEVVFYDVAFNEATGRVSDQFSCTTCGAALTKRQREIRKTNVRTLAGDTISRIEMRPVLVAWRHGGETGRKKFDMLDMQVLERVAALKPPSFPSGELPNMHMTHERNNLPNWGISSHHHFWPDRPLAALALLWDWTAEEPNPRTRLALRFWIEQAFWGLSWMNRYKVIQHGKIGGSLVNQYMTGVYYVPSLTAECSVRYNLEGSSPARGKRQSLVKLWKSSPATGRRRNDQHRIFDVADDSGLQCRLRIRRSAVRREHLLRGLGIPHRVLARRNNSPVRGSNTESSQGCTKGLGQIRRTDEELLRRVLSRAEAGQMDDRGILKSLQRRVAAHSRRARLSRIRGGGHPRVRQGPTLLPPGDRR